MEHHLLDVNLLIALLDQDHPGHGVAQRWADRCAGTFVTCPIVENGAFRIMTQPAYARGAAALPFALVRDAFVQTIARIKHRQWPDALSLADERWFDHDRIHGPRQLTDIYLLGLAVANEGCLVTMNRGIPLAAVRGATSSHLLVL